MFERVDEPERRETFEQTVERLKQAAGRAAEAARCALDGFGEIALPLVRNAAWSIPGSFEELPVSAHVVAAGATAGVCAVADAFVAPGLGAAIELAGGAAVAGIAASAVCASVRRYGATDLRRRLVVAEAAAEVRAAHGGLLAAGALHGVACVALGTAGPSACLPAAGHVARATARRFVSNPLGRVPALGLALQAVDATKAAVSGARFVRDVERAADRIVARHAAMARLVA